MAKKVTSIAKSTSALRPAAPEPVTTQRAYTLRLRGVDKEDNSWREALWATHEAINKGAKAFGDWLLTLRGGLDHGLAEPPPPRKGKKRNDEEAAALRKNRRILLALSWLSVEDARGAPSGTCRIAAGAESESVRRDKVLAALRGILADRRVGKRDIEGWIVDCEDSLGARIRDDAVWVNRSAVFDARAAEFKGLTRGYATETVLSFFGPAEDYFALPDVIGDEEAAGSANDGPEFRTLARQWASTNFGTGDKSDTGQIVKSLRLLAKADFARFERGTKADLLAGMAKKVGGPTPDMDGVRIGVGWSTGRPSKGRLAIDKLPDRVTKTALETMKEKFTEEAAEKEDKAGLRDVPSWMPRFRALIEESCSVPFVGGRDHIGEFSVMLDHAARRVSIGHSWIKRAEAERRRFEVDARKLDAVPEPARGWLDKYVTDRSGTSGAAAEGGYRIRRRAIEGWDEVVKQWKRTVCKTVEDRIVATRELQADPEIEKFGDIQLFEALAVEDAECVWRTGGKADPQALRDYVLSRDARFKQMRFKVPAYRHPDPLRHPVFGDFGNSRWEIEYGAHEAAKVARAGRRAPAKGTPDESRLADTRAIRLGLWDGSGVRGVDMRWSSKRLAKVLGIAQNHERNKPQPVTRADRLGRAASGLDAGALAVPSGLFDQKDWNGRLQAPRAQLDALAKRVDKHNWDAKAKEMRDRLSWLVTFSAKLECRGPFIDYASDNGITPNRKGEYYPNSEINKNQKREGHAKLILSRLPGLRVLSVDLGHRYAAACAVWQTLSETEFKREIEGRKKAPGSDGPSGLYCHTTHKDPKTGKERTTIYRRIGNPTLADKSVHPAPWARLDRQFLIKLQGEEKPARAATNGKLKDGSKIKLDEVALVANMARDLGLLRDDADRAKGRGVDDLMRRALRVATLGLKRHGRVGKIAYALNPECPGIPGTGGTTRSITRGDDDHVRFLTNALVDWHTLATDTEWDGSQARALWNQHIRLLPGGFDIPEPVQPEPDSMAPTRAQRKAHEEEVRTRIDPVARHLATGKPAATAKMHEAWKQLWERADGDCAVVPKVKDGQKGPRETKVARAATGFHAHLRALTDWIMGKHLAGADSEHWNRSVGGLSLTRIATMRSLYQLHKAFAMRPTPEKVQGAPERGESNTGVAQSILDTMERMREQRVKQIASRIVEGALGVGRMPKSHGHDRRRPQEQVDKPCHAIVIENLRNYRPEEVQTRRENKALLNWSAGKVRKYLEEGCQLHGLHLREVMPNYTSRQCSRTGLPGVRCQDVHVDPATGEPKAFWWKKAVTSATEKGDAESMLLVDLDRMLRSADGTRPATVRVPRRGGDLFVAAGGDGKAIQADLNAAANIGLRAVLDPDFIGKWWYVPCDTVTGKPAKDKCGGSLCPILAGLELKPETPPSKKTDSKAREKTNAWRDLGATGGWRPHVEYWPDVQKRAVQALRNANKLG